jgi:hypothetical protein
MRTTVASFLIILSLTGMIRTEERFLDPKAAIRLSIGFDGDAFRLDKVIQHDRPEEQTKKVVRIVASKGTLKEPLRLPIQVVELHTMKVQSKLNETAEEYHDRLSSVDLKDKQNLFVLFTGSPALSAQSNPRHFTTMGNPCSPGSVLLIATIRFNDDKKIERYRGPKSMSWDLMYLLLKKFGIHEKSSCTCKNSTEPGCIFPRFKTKDEQIRISPPKCILTSIAPSKDQVPGCINKPYDPSESGVPVCGNGIIEEGEQCECFSISECKATKCNPKTCQNLNSGETPSESDKEEDDPNEDPTAASPPAPPASPVSPVVKWTLVGVLVVACILLLIVLAVIFWKRSHLIGSTISSGSSRRLKRSSSDSTNSDSLKSNKSGPPSLPYRSISQSFNTPKKSGSRDRSPSSGPATVFFDKTDE